MDAIDRGKEVVRIEADAVRALESKINEAFASAVDLIEKLSGRVVITGMGKSGIIARKIVATMNSTGTPAIYMHQRCRPWRSWDGQAGGCSNLISKSGDTEEVLQLLPMFKRIGVPVISIIGNKTSKLGRESEFVLDASVEQEACPYDLAPTASTTAALVIGDALALALLDRKNFTEEEFAMFHPGGNIGKRLFLKVEELMAKGKDIPKALTGATLRDTILVMTSGRLGAACVVNPSGELAGIVTDGDLRRLLQKNADFSHTVVDDVMTKNPKVIKQNSLAVAAIETMENFNISQLIVVDDARKPIGMSSISMILLKPAFLQNPIHEKNRLQWSVGTHVRYGLRLLAGSFLGCEDRLKPTVVPVHGKLPDQESWNSTIQFSDSGITKGVLRAGHVLVFNNDNMTYLGDSIRVHFYDDSGRHTSYLTADSGIVNNLTNDLQAIDNVYAHSDSGTSLWTQQLFWNNKTQKVTSNVFVRIVSPREKLQGFGFESDRDLRNYRIFNVSGEASGTQPDTAKGSQ